MAFVADAPIKPESNQTTAHTVILQEFLEIHHNFGDHHAIYTDGTKVSNGVAAVDLDGDSIMMARLNTNATVFTAELYAILLALRHIQQNDLQNSVIYSDSLSSVRALLSCFDSKNHLVKRVRVLLTQLCSRGLSICLCWVPSHTGIPGNERADREARRALAQEESTLGLPSQDILSVLKRAVYTQWQQEWDMEENNKLRVTQPHIFPEHRTEHINRFSEVLYARLRIGHTWLTHHNLLRGQDPLFACTAVTA
ncbi:ribonuclease H1-like [Ornithodoros turicata]|uniref:ribonuclease H1-like n=1 Tax=Ornithodoros turicata TaxID=34597 RepID=UPI00313A064F